AFVRPDNIPVTVNSFYCDYNSGEVRLSDELADYKWVSVNELGKYPLISGIREEIEMADHAIRKGEQVGWQGKYNTGFEKSKIDGTI
ncbi:MAG: hypothetical protein Q8N58_02815, partial [bacterium]|nr:hypothetical protein [bacterium]